MIPDLSIIILNWNTKQLLLDCVESIFEYSKNIVFEIIVCDNASNDGSVDAVRKKFGNKIKLIQNPDNVGFSAGNNPGLKVAKGRYLLLLNSDTKIDYNVFPKLVKWMDDNFKVGIAGPKLLNKDGSLQNTIAGYLPNLLGIFCQQTIPLHTIPFLNRFLPTLHATYQSYYVKSHQVGWVQGSALLIRREVYDQIGGLDENIFMYVEEVEYCKRVQNEGWQVWYLANEYIWHLERGSSVSGKKGAILGTYKGLKYYFSKHKAKWQLPILICLLKFGALFRLPLSPKVYWKAFRV